MTNKINLAVVGATSLKGEAFLSRLFDAEMELDEVFLLDDESMAGEHVEFGRKDKLVNAADGFDFTKVQHVVLIGDATLTEKIYPAIQLAGCSIIDVSGFLGQKDDVSLATLIEDDNVPAVVAIPEATTLQLWVVLQPLLQETSITSLNVTVTQCAAQGGKAALEELGQQTARLLNFQEAQTSFFEKQLAFNVIPQVGGLTDNGDTVNESVVRQQISRLFVLPRTEIDITMLWSPVFYGDVVTVSLQTQGSVVMEYILEQWQSNPLLNFTAAESHTPVTDASGKSIINLGRVRTWQTAAENTHVSFCVMADPIQLSAAICLQVLKHQLLG